VSERGLVWDAFLFHDELDLLDLRLEILDAVVDRFVVVESTVTFRGRAKPLHFAEHRERFERWADRIVHVVVEDAPDVGDDGWGRERFQRDAVGRALGACRGRDVVLVSDVDEIPHPDRVAERRLGRYEQVETQYHLDCVQDEAANYGTVARWWFEVVALGAQRVRDERFSLPVVPGGGWHFSSVMSAERISHKLRSYSHAEYDTPEQHAAVAERRAALVDLFGNRPTPLRVLAPGDPVLPEVLRSPGHRWSHLLRGDGDGASSSCRSPHRPNLVGRMPSSADGYGRPV